MLSMANGQLKKSLLNLLILIIGYDVSNEATAIQKLNHNWGLTADKLVVGTTNAANVNVEQNINGSTAEQELVVNDLAVKTGSKITLKGDMTLNGKFSSGTSAEDPSDDTFGVELVAQAIDVQAGGFLTIQNDALNAIKIEGDTVTAKGYTDGALKSHTGSTVKLAFADDYGVISDKALQELRKKLFGLTNDTDKLDGTLSIGGAQISGLEVNEKGEIAWDKVATNKDVVTDVTNDALTNAKVTGVGSDPVRGTFGSMTSTTISSEFGGKITTDERLTLGNAAANEGYFAAQVDQDGKVIGALGFDVKADTDLTLKNGGQAAEVALQAGAGLVVDGGQGKTTLTKVSGNKGEVTLKSGALEVTDKAGVVVSVLNSEAGSSLTAQKLELKTTNDEAVIKGDLNISGKTTIAGDAQFSGVNTFGGAFSAKNAEFNGGKTVFAEGQTAKITTNLDVIGDLR